MNTKLHAVTDVEPLMRHWSEHNGERGARSGSLGLRAPLSAMHASPAGQRVSDYTGAAALLGGLPKAEWLLADRGYDADGFREALKDKGIKPVQGGFDPLDQIGSPFTPGRKSRAKPIKYDKRRYNRSNRIEIRFGRLKDWPIVGKTVPRTVFGSSS